MFTIPAYKTSFPSSYFINTIYICKNHSVVYKNHTVIYTNHTVVYRILRRIFELFKLTITKKATGSFRSDRSLIFCYFQNYSTIITHPYGSGSSPYCIARSLLYSFSLIGPGLPFLAMT